MIKLLVVEVDSLGRPVRACSGCGSKASHQIVGQTVVHSRPSSESVDLCKRCGTRMAEALRRGVPVASQGSPLMTADDRVNELVETMVNVDLAARLSVGVASASIADEREWLDALRRYRDAGGSAFALRSFLDDSARRDRLGPAAFVVRQAKVFDRLITCLVKSGDYPSRRAMDAEFDESMHEAIHALKRLRELAAAIGGTWTRAAEMVFAARLRWVMENTAAGHHHGATFGVHWISESLDEVLSTGSSYEDAVDKAMAEDAE